METKKCSKCFKIKPIEEFSWKIKAKNRRATECKVCHRILRKKHYEDNKSIEKLRVSTRKKQLRKWLNEYKLLQECKNCGESHPATLQFHHTDPSIKEIAISAAVNMGWSIARMKKEIDKCDVLCANCHAVEHWQ